MGVTSSSTRRKTGIHYKRPKYFGDDFPPSAMYPPPTYIDFASGDLRPPFPPTRPSALSFHCQWLGGRHDGYPFATTLNEYVELRQSGSALGTLEYAALIQSQLTFGILEVVLRMKIPEAFLLVHVADGTTTLSTANLTTLFRDLYHRTRVRHYPEQCRSWLEDVAAALSEANRRLRTYRKNQTTNPFLAAGLHQKVFEDILRALCMIGHSLNLLLLQSPSDCDPNRHIPLLTFHQLPDTKPAEDQLRAQGWCPLTIAALVLSDFVILEYAKSFRPFLRKTGEHSLCTDTVCAVNHIDSNTYIQRHFPEECKCASIIPPFHPVESLLSDDRIPVVALTDQKLAVHAAEDGPYIAISHVWADGLGSTTEKGLSACQVDRMAFMAASLVPGGAFWVDALCVPKKKDLRKRAIQLMAKTYANAAAVLVIDAGIRSCSKDAPLEEKLFRIVTSGWLHRLWTYQEAMLAKRLWFEFSDGFRDLEDLIPSSEEISTSPLVPFLCDTLSDIRNYIMAGHALESFQLPIHVVAHAVQWRTTSRLEDETLAIAGLLQIDVRKLLNASSPDERMRSLLLQKRTVSPRIIFATAPKISGLPCFSWAPRSFMTGPHPGAWLGEESAICTPTGLLAEFESFIFAEPMELDEDKRYVIRDTTRPAHSFLLRRVVLVRDTRREFCNGILFDRSVSTIPGITWDCVGVRMVDMEEGTSDERVQVCHYQDVRFSLDVIDISKRSRRQTTESPVIDAKWFPRMNVKVV